MEGPSQEGHSQTPSARAGLFTALSWVRDLAFSVLLAVILIVFIYQPVKVEGTSMMPALTDQEHKHGSGRIEPISMKGPGSGGAKATYRVRWSVRYSDAGYSILAGSSNAWQNVVPMRYINSYA